MQTESSPTTLEEIMSLVCESLPEDWQIDINLRRGEAWVTLCDPDGDMVDMGSEDDTNTVLAMVRNRVNHARAEDGLGAV